MWMFLRLFVHIGQFLASFTPQLPVLDITVVVYFYNFANYQKFAQDKLLPIVLMWKFRVTQEVKYFPICLLICHISYFMNFILIPFTCWLRLNKGAQWWRAWTLETNVTCLQESAVLGRCCHLAKILVACFGHLEDFFNF